ncbi:Bax inhibitor-1/YccA family protein [Parabacteroides sp. FAFU027]|uniref:Bax inhibitor-1/YccA family protein n=1 Tax=Parabacteroides sp. FAFU027 TaxID=2922715 RepID=UPI001FAEDA6C|nr:Bax inhibitor-1/YccA family protein [Parabacteroides sp. FAFU027]
MTTTSLTQVQTVQINLMQKVYVWMCTALLITAATAYVVSGSEAVLSLIFSSKVSFYVLLFAQLGLVWYLTASIQKLTLNTASILFVIYSFLTGVTLSSIFVVYTSASIASTFVVTAATFGAMSLYGYYTKRDLTSWGNLLFMALLGLIIASVVNLFMNNETIYWITTYAGVLIFVGLTAYDTQKIKALVSVEDNEQTQKLAILGALSLYLDFINLFLYLLRFLGRKK